MTDVSSVSAYREAMAVAGVPITLQRVSGYAPNVTVTSAVSLNAIVRNVQPDTTSTAESGLSASQPGAITQADRLIIVLADDLAAANFPVPVDRGDQIVLPDSAEVLNVLRVDAYKRRIAGAIEIFAAGVS
jgi:hypothetical protein